VRAESPAKSMAHFVRSGAVMTTDDLGDVDQIDDLTEQVIGAAIAVHTSLGPGLLESVYQDCLAIHLRQLKLRFQREVRFPIVYLGERVRCDLKIDLLVEGRLVVEVKAVERIHPVFKAQVITYLKLSNCPAGLLLNFNATSLRGGLQRLDRPDIYAKKLAARRLRFK
jgi:GxxExxY protein